MSVYFTLIHQTTGTAWQVAVNTMVQMAHERGHLRRGRWKVKGERWKWEATWRETDLWDADREDSVAQLFPHKQPKNLGRGENCYAWSNSSDEYFSHLQTLRKITCTSFFFKGFFERILRKVMMMSEMAVKICYTVTLKGALNHSGAVTIKTFFSLAG